VLLVLLPSSAAAFGPYPPATTIFVDAANPATGSGSAENPFSSIQNAIDAANAGDVVGVAAGSYTETLVLAPDVVVLGSGAATTTLDSGGAAPAVEFADRATFAAFRVTGVAQRGNAVQGGDVTDVVLRDNEIFGNEARAVAFGTSTGTILRNRIAANPAFTGPPTYCPCDGVYLVSSAMSVIGNEIDGDDPNGNVRAVEIAQTTPGSPGAVRVERNEIVGRIHFSFVSAPPQGEHRVQGNLIVSGNGFTEAINVAFSPGAGLIANNTIIGGSGIFLQGDSVARIIGNIVAFGRDGIVGPTSGLEVSYNDVFGNNRNYSEPDLTGIAGNVSVDPEFVDRPSGDFRLSPYSPILDAGPPTPEDPGAVDLAGAPRIVDGDANGVGLIDIGAFEFQGTQSCDVDGNRDVDDADVEAIFARSGEAPRRTQDPADANTDGSIDVLDARECLGVATDGHALALELTPSRSFVRVGDSVRLNVRIDGLGDGTALGAYDLAVRWDPLMLEATGIEADTFLGSPSLGEAWVDAAAGTGEASLAVLSLLSPAALYGIQPGAFGLAWIDFEAVGVGMAGFEVSSLVLSDAFGGPLIPDEILVGELIVPEPQPIASSLAGMIALEILRRRRCARRVPRRAAARA
jgi:hypothetical protein